MRKFLLLSAIVTIAGYLNAQAPVTSPPRLYNAAYKQNIHEETSPVLLQQSGTSSRANAARTAANNIRTANTNKLKSLANGTPLNSQKIGSAGNLLTITSFNCNQLYVNNPLSLVSFIHRVDNTVISSGNIAQYAYDYSSTAGVTWTSNIGPITVGPIPNGDNVDNIGSDPHGRFPQALIYNPNGNTNLANTELVYNGTYHNEAPTGTTGSWLGQMYGRGPISGPSTSYNVHVDTLNGGIVNIGTGMCQSVPGVFWSVNQVYTGSFATGSNDITRGIILEKGLWNSVSHDVDWTDTVITQAFDSQSISGSIVSAAQSFTIAFDPTGQYGWIACLGDITNGPVDSVNQPIFWNSTDGGSTWNGPNQIPLDSLPGVVEALNTTAIYGNGAVTSGVPTTSFEANLTVDYNGNPHLLCTVGNGGGYSIEQGAGYTMYDVTLNPSNACTPTWNGWAAVFIDSVQTLRGNTTADATPLTEDNRPLVSRSPDGTKVFFFWSTSDEAEVGSDANSSPNLFTRAFDLMHSTSTPSINLTQGDPLWGGPTVAFPQGGNIEGGSVQGAFYSTVSPLALTNANGFTVPLVLTQIDYTSNTDMSGNPAQFWYIDNINFSPYDFTIGNTASITINGPDTIILHVDSPYTDLGATIAYGDTACTHSGNLHVVTNTSGINDTLPGTYQVNYSAEDGSGNIYGNANRTIIVVSPPHAYFVYLEEAGNTVQFTDSSLYNPTWWSWNFGDGQTDIGPDNITTHTYNSIGTYNVCLTDSNQYGMSNTYCTTVNVVSGINQVDFASHINMFPNPTSGLVAITLAGVAPDFTVSVFNVLGEEVMPVSEYKAGTTNVQMNLNSLADGIYMVKIQSNMGSSVKRVTVARR